ncbi:MAG: carbohydrate ABC transporter permease [Chloroflexi bacterium]|nr:carbohydrate ABC transporter permease [Chloroflexota bacterium]
MTTSREDRIFNSINNLVLGAVMLVIAYPLYFTIIASVSDPLEVARGAIALLPKGFTIDAYRNVLGNSTVWLGYRNTAFYTITGTLLDLGITLTCAYALSKKWLPGRRLLNWCFLFTMYFGGGLIPTYLLVKGLGLINTPYVMVVLGAISVYNLIVVRNFFETSIPGELYEAARVDGCSEFGIFLKIALPLSKVIIAVMALFYGVARWNSYFNALLYLGKESLYPLQLVLRNILLMNQTMDMSSMLDSDQVQAVLRRILTAETMKYALIFVASFPVLCAYPFVQKYFVRGVMIGSVKG